MRIFYKVNYNYEEIKPVEVIRDTSAFVIVPCNGWRGETERREKKDGVYFETWEQARDFLVDKWSTRVDAEMRGVEYAKGKLDKIYKLTKENV